MDCFEPIASPAAPQDGIVGCDHPASLRSPDAASPNQLDNIGNLDEAVCQGDGMRFTPIIGTLAYLWDRDRDQVLLIRRNARADDDHFGKVNGLGGKVEAGEDVVTSARREIREEAAVEATEMALRGTITFTDFGPNREQWLIFVFLVERWTGDCASSNAEGSLEWVSRVQLLDACEGGPAREDLPMWAGDRHFVPLVFDQDPRPFHGSMPYDADVPISWDHVRL